MSIRALESTSYWVPRQQQSHQHQQSQQSPTGPTANTQQPHYNSSTSSEYSSSAPPYSSAYLPHYNSSSSSNHNNNHSSGGASSSSVGQSAAAHLSSSTTTPSTSSLQHQLLRTGHSHSHGETLYSSSSSSSLPAFHPSKAVSALSLNTPASSSSAATLPPFGGLIDSSMNSQSGTIAATAAVNSAQSSQQTYGNPYGNMSSSAPPYATSYSNLSNGPYSSSSGIGNGYNPPHTASFIPLSQAQAQAQSQAQAQNQAQQQQQLQQQHLYSSSVGTAPSYASSLASSAGNGGPHQSSTDVYALSGRQQSHQSHLQHQSPHQQQHQQHHQQLQQHQQQHQQQSQTQLAQPSQHLHHGAMGNADIHVHGGHFVSGPIVKTEAFFGRDVDDQGFVSPTSPFSISAAGSMMGHGMRPKRKQVKNACVNCQKACKKCDEGRPCSRCIKYGLTDSCQDSLRKERKRGIKRGPYKRRATTGSQPNYSAASAVQLSPDGHHSAHSEGNGYGSYSHGSQHHYLGHGHHASFGGSTQHHQQQQQQHQHAHYQQHGGSASSMSPYEHSYGSQSPDERTRSLEEAQDGPGLSSSHHQQHGYHHQQHQYASQPQQQQHQQHSQHNSPAFSSASAPSSVQRGTNFLTEVKQETAPSPSLYARETLMQPPSARAFAAFDRIPSTLYGGSVSNANANTTNNGRTQYGGPLPISAPASTVGFGGIPGRSATSLGFGNSNSNSNSNNATNSSNNGGTTPASSLPSASQQQQQQQQSLQQSLGNGHNRLHSEGSLSTLSLANSSNPTSAHSLSPRTPLSLSQSGSYNNSSSNLLYHNNNSGSGDLGLMGAPVSAGSSISSPGTKFTNNAPNSSYVHHPVPSMTGSGFTPGSFLATSASPSGSFNLQLPHATKLRAASTNADLRGASSSPRPQSARQLPQRAFGNNGSGRDDSNKDELAPIKEPGRFLPSSRFATGGSGAHAVEYKSRALKAEQAGGDDLVGLGAA